MDISKEYIKMCEKAFKYLGILPDGGCPSQFSLKGDSRLLLSSAEWTEKFDKPSVAGQIYRQDQLQEMVRGDRTSWQLTQFFWNWLWTKEEVTAEKSLEQLWLLFAMCELFKKTWTGEEWK